MFQVTLGDNVFKLDKKTPILELIPENEKKKYFVAKVNNRLRELSYELCYDCQVELLDKTNADAIRIYETTLRFIIAKSIFYSNKFEFIATFIIFI